MVEQKAISWCLKHDIKVYIKPLAKTKEVQVEVNYKGKIVNSGKTYPTQSIASKKCWELYKFFYDKNTRVKGK
jgi:hypothetical protein